VNTPTTESTSRKRIPRDSARILGDCRDIAIHRLLVSFGSILDRVGEMLMDRASRTDVREEQTTSLEAREVLQQGKAGLLAAFEKRLRAHIDEGIAGNSKKRTEFAKLETDKLTLIDTHAMDESVVTGNITRVVENLCHDEVQLLNRGIGHLLGQPDLEIDRNPFAPTAIVEAFSEALQTVKAEAPVKFAILKEMNRASLAEINSIYGDLNKHLQNLHVMPAGSRRALPIRRALGERRPKPNAEEGAQHAEPGGAAPGEIDIMELFRRRFGGDTAAPQPQRSYAPKGEEGHRAGTYVPGGGSYGAPPFPTSATDGPAGGATGGVIQAGGTSPGHRGFAGGSPGASQPFPAISLEGAARYVPKGPMAPTPSGYVPGAPIMATPVLGEGLARLQSGESDFDLGEGTFVQFSGIPEGKHNVLRDLQQSPLGKKANQLESMTIELVAMLFDFIFETKDLPDGIKALLARLQIPVLKAAMLDGAFFAKKNHPSRLLVNALAEAGRGWTPVMGTNDPLYSHIDALVHRILDGFTDDLTIFDEAREKLERFLADEEQAAEANIQSTAVEIDQTDRKEMAEIVAKSEIERRIEMYPVPNFLAWFLRQQWVRTLQELYLTQGEESEPWEQAIAMLEDLVWSVQPKRTKDDRKHLVALLPALLKRLSGALERIEWPPEGREKFMANLVEAHAASVKPAVVTAALGTQSVAEQAKAEAEQAKVDGDPEKAAKAEALAEAMTQASPEPAKEHEVVEDQFLEIAQDLERGTWIEFEADDGQLQFAKLAWISPLRGTYLFTNRQGLKALSMNAEELADRFRTDRARLVEAAPLIDRAFGSVMASFAENPLAEAG